ncbi:cupredoxin domain-containing protein [Candidatus Woesearchaeota archaeon]|nr:cupredoxin domain-containing protein [Candidatus Woesearchaeota archaeon]
MKNILFVLGILSLIILAACAQQQPPIGQGTPVQARTPAIGEDAGSVEEKAVKTEAGQAQGTVTTETKAEVKEIEVTAKRWEFSPNPIQVNKGDKVRLKITSVDVKHGFNLPDFNLRADLNPGETATVEFTVDKAGSFSFFCDIACGAGHRDMKGTLIVS